MRRFARRWSACLIVVGAGLLAGCTTSSGVVTQGPDAVSDGEGAELPPVDGMPADGEMPDLLIQDEGPGMDMEVSVDLTDMETPDLPPDQEIGPEILDVMEDGDMGGMDVVDSGPDLPPPECELDEDCQEVAPEDLCDYDVLGCVEGACEVVDHVTVTCDTSEDPPCQVTSCDPATGVCGLGPAPDDMECSDGLTCTTGDRCVEGACVPVTDACECVETADCAAFEDGDACNGTLVCVDNGCAVDPETVVTCSQDGTGQCETAVCAPATGECAAQPVADGVACDDADVCTPTDTCQAGVCTGSGELCAGDCCAPGAQPGCGDAAVVACVCATMPACCSAAWDVDCINEAMNGCALECPAGVCGDSICEAVETPCSCPADCPNDALGCEACECGGSGGDCACDETCILEGDCCDNSCDVCGICPGVCGNGVCEGTETCDSCQADCGCTDGLVCTKGQCTSCFDHCQEYNAECGTLDSCDCGDCTNGLSCVDGACVGTCASQDHLGCNAGDVWWFDSCGEPETPVESCAHGCSGGACGIEFYEDAEYRTTSEGQSFWCPSGACTEPQWSAGKSDGAILVMDATSTDYTFQLSVAQDGWLAVCWTSPTPVVGWSMAQARMEFRGEAVDGDVCGTYAMYAGAFPGDRSRVLIPQTEVPLASYQFSIWADIDPPVGSDPVCVTVDNGPDGGNDCAAVHDLHVFKVWMQLLGARQAE